MHMTTKKSITFYILYGLTSSFYINRILTRYIFQEAGKFAWLIILGIALFLLFISPFLYSLFNTVQQKNIGFKQVAGKISRIVFFLYLFINSSICFLFLLTLINASWLMNVSYTFVLIPFLVILYYVFQYKNDVFLRLVNLFSIPIFLQYLLFVFAKNKSMDMYALIPYQSSLKSSWLLILMIMQIILYLFLGIFYIDEYENPLSKKSFYITLIIFLFSLVFDAVVITGQFGNTVSRFPFIYYESWCMINFGQYFGYLDIFAFFYWVTSSFSCIGLNFYLIKKNYSKSVYNSTYFALYFFLIFILTHGFLYSTIRSLLLASSTITLLIAIVIYIRKVVNHEIN